MTTALGLEVRGVSHAFVPDGAAPVPALREVSFTLEPGEFAVVVGHNGSGKSTLLRVVAGELEADSGSTALTCPSGPREVHTLSLWERGQATAKVVQDPPRNLIPALTVGENLSLAADLPEVTSPWRRAIRAPARKRFESLLTDMGLPGRLDVVAGTLSFGQQQLLALQMAFVRRPALLLLDEPTAALDRRNAAQCLSLLEDLWRATGTTILMVTHDLAAALRHGNRLLILEEGRLTTSLVGDGKARLDLPGLFAMCGYAEMPA